MNKYVKTLVMPKELEKLVRNAAKADGRSVNSWILQAIKKKLSTSLS